LTTAGGSFFDVSVFGSRARWHTGADLASVKSITYA